MGLEMKIGFGHEIKQEAKLGGGLIKHDDRGVVVEDHIHNKENEKLIMTYQMVMANSQKSLEEQVNLFLRQGWRLQGGACVAVGSDDINGSIYYVQAITKESE